MQGSTSPACGLSLPFLRVCGQHNSSVQFVTARLFIVLCAAVSPAHADIFSFVDENGVAHFSNVPADARYEILIAAAAEGTRAGERVDARRVVANARRYEELIESAAARSNVHSQLLKAVIAVESGFNARAVSPVGARGLMQLMPATARRYGVRDVFDPSQNISAGARYLRDLLKRFGNDVELALAAYNAGEQAVERHGRRVPPYNETQRYVPRVLNIYRALMRESAQRRAESTAFHYRNLRIHPVTMESREWAVYRSKDSQDWLRVRAQPGV